MPSLSQSLFWAYMHSEAKLSCLTKSPSNLWHKPSSFEKENILRANWYDFHQIFTLTFQLNSIDEEELPMPLILSFFFLNPRWFLVNEFDFTIKVCWEKASSLNKPSIFFSDGPSVVPAYWFLLKQNDPDLLRLIVSSFIEDKIFIPPFTRFILSPIGITPPVIKPAFLSPSPLNIDPTSNKFVKKGHKLTQKLCNSSGFLTRPEIILILSDKVG